MEPEANLVITIPAVQVTAKYALFQIFVTRGEQVWSVRRRYQDFSKLHSAMKAQLPPGVLPELPPKAIRIGLSKFQPDFIEARRAKLELYLSELVSAVQPERVDVLDDFILYSEHCLKNMVDQLDGIPALAHIHAMLSKAIPATTTKNQRGQADADSDSDADDAATVSSDASAPVTPARALSDTELLEVMQGALRMMKDAKGAMQSSAEDVRAAQDAAHTRNSALDGQLRDRLQEATDFKQYMFALRERRALEAKKERAALGVATTQSRTVAAEWVRVGRIICCHKIVAAAHAAATERYIRSPATTAWEAVAPARVGPAATQRSPTAAVTAAATAPVGLVPELADQVIHVSAACSEARQIAAALSKCLLSGATTTGTCSDLQPSRPGAASAAATSAVVAVAVSESAALTRRLLESHASLCSGPNQASTIAIAEQAAANTDLAQLVSALRQRQRPQQPRGTVGLGPPVEWTAQVLAGAPAPVEGVPASSSDRDTPALSPDGSSGDVFAAAGAGRSSAAAAGGGVTAFASRADYGPAVSASGGSAPRTGAAEPVATARRGVNPYFRAPAADVLPVVEVVPSSTANSAAMGIRRPHETIPASATSGLGNPFGAPQAVASQTGTGNRLSAGVGPVGAKSGSRLAAPGSTASPRSGAGNPFA